MATTSRVPAAIDALVAICRASAALAGVAVFDGGPVTDLSGTDLLFIGWKPEDDVAAVITQDFNAAGARTRDENFALGCYVESRGGDVDMGVRRARVFALLGAVEQALRATPEAPGAPTLNGAVAWAHLTAGALRQVQTPDGALAGVEFTVSCRARI